MKKGLLLYCLLASLVFHVILVAIVRVETANKAKKEPVTVEIVRPREETRVARLSKAIKTPKTTPVVQPKPKPKPKPVVLPKPKPVLLPKPMPLPLPKPMPLPAPKPKPKPEPPKTAKDTNERKIRPLPFTPNPGVRKTSPPMQQANPDETSPAALSKGSPGPDSDKTRATPKVNLPGSKSARGNDTMRTGQPSEPVRETGKSRRLLQPTQKDLERYAKVAQGEEGLLGPRKNGEITLDTDELMIMSYELSFLKNQLMYYMSMYPNDEISQGIRGSVLVRTTISRTGKVLEREVIKSSGYQTLDNTAIRMLSQITQLSPLPAKYSKDTFAITFGISFEHVSSGGSAFIDFYGNKIQ